MRKLTIDRNTLNISEGRRRLCEDFFKNSSRSAVIMLSTPLSCDKSVVISIATHNLAKCSDYSLLLAFKTSYTIILALARVTHRNGIFVLHKTEEGRSVKRGVMMILLEAIYRPSATQLVQRSRSASLFPW